MIAYHNEDTGESQQIRMELELVMTAIGCSVRKAITRLQHEQACSAGVSYSPNHEQHEVNVEALERALRSALVTMSEMSATIEHALGEEIER